MDNTAWEIADYHVNVKGWPGIGYHFLVHQGGGLDYVGDILTARANVAKRNPECLGICLPGDYTSTIPPEPQLETTRELVIYLLYLLPWAEVRAHREVALPGYETSCCGDTWPQWQGRLVA